MNTKSTVVLVVFLHLQVTNLADEVEALRRQVTEGGPAQKVS